MCVCVYECFHHTHSDTSWLVIEHKLSIRIHVLRTCTCTLGVVIYVYMYYVYTFCICSEWHGKVPANI